MAGGEGTPPAAPDTPEPGKEHEWIKPRLGKAEKKGAENERKELFAKFGVKSMKELEDKWAAGQTAVQAGLTEQERTTQRLAELEPLAASAETYKAAYERRLNAEFDALPDNIKEAIDKVAEGDAFKREQQIESFRAAGFLKPEQPAPPAAPPGAPPVAPPTTTDHTPPPPPAGSTQSMFEKYDAIENQTQKQIFYQTHSRAIEASRPAT